MPNSIDIATIVQSAVEDRRLCRMAGIDPVDANQILASRISALIRRLEARGVDNWRASTAAYDLYDKLAPDGEQVN